MQDATHDTALRRRTPGQPARRPHRVAIEVALRGTDAWRVAGVLVLAEDAEDAQDRAIAHVERTGRCHRHVLSVRRLKEIP